MISLVIPLLVGLTAGLGAYVIIKASNDRQKVMRILTIISLSISSIILVILLIFLFNMLRNL
jgi:ABC-type dipeptide/oligopeptide/nickel transport system permease component